MFGYLIWHEEGKPRVSLERRMIGGVNFCVLEAQGRERRVSRRVGRAMREMSARGVSRCIIPTEWPEVWRSGFSEVEEDSLRQAIFPRLLDWLSSQGKISLDGATVELSAPWASRPVWEAAWLLSRRCRYLCLRMEGADALREDLWRRYGVAAGGGEGQASLQICFGEPREGVPALLLGQNCGSRQKAVYGLPEAFTQSLAPYPVTPQLVSALWKGGALPTEEIRVTSLDFRA